MPGITDQIRSSATLYSTNIAGNSISSSIYDAFLSSEMLTSSFSGYTETRDDLRSRIRELEEENKILKNIIIENEL